MCGIAGIYNTAAVEQNMLWAENMAEAIFYRGPDASGVQALDRTVFAHRRLAIIDLDAAANQPMSDCSQSCMITFNGEIYNYRELRQKLTGKWNFQTASDTEVILALYRTGGVSALSQLDGMFALAIYDHDNGKLLLMRDPLGKKPLYYFVSAAGEVIFASTLSALKVHPAWRGEIRTEAVDDFLTYEYVPGNESIYREVFKLPPASIMQFDCDGKSFLHYYWRVDYSHKFNYSFAEAADILRSKLEAAVRKRLIADVPCGIFLSGGIDSAIVAMLSARSADSALSAFTIGFEQKSYDERYLAADTVEWINQHTTSGLQHYCQLVDCRSFDTLKHLAAIYGEPFADFSLLPTYFLSGFASRQVKVVLSGDGADEIFGGYERYQAMRCCEQLERYLPAACRRTLAWAAERIFPDLNKRSHFSRLRRLLKLAAVPAGQRYIYLMTQLAGQSRHELYGERMQSALSHDHDAFLQQALSAVTSCEANEKYAECDLHTYLEGDILVKVDRASMAESLEVRSPFLDRDVVEFASGLPFEFKQRGVERKRILKSAMADCLSPLISQQRKRGFAVPIGSWFRCEWQTLLAEHLLDGRLVAGNWMNKNTLHKIIMEHNSLHFDHSELLGSLLMLELFLENEIA